MDSRKMSRRQMLRTLGLAGLGTLLAACQPQVVEKIVERTVEVPKEVTKIVEKEKVVQQTVVVEKKVEVKAAAPEAVVIRAHARLGTQGDHFSIFAQRFNEKNQGKAFVKCELFANADYFQKLDTMIAGKTIGDVFWLYLGGGFEQYAAQAVYAPIDDAVSATSYDLKQFFPESVECLKYKGKLFALPWTVHVGSASATYYSKDLLQKAGVAEPKESWTWDECIEATKKLTNASAGQWGMFMSNYYAGNPVLLARGQGGDLLSKDGTKCTLSTEETRKGLQIFSDLFSKWKVNPMSTQMVGSIYQMFAANKVAMFQSGFWGKTVGDYVAPGSWGVVLSPYGPKGRGQTMFVDMVGVTSGSKYVKEAFTYMTELCSYDAGMDIWQVRKSVPGSRPDVWNSEAATKDAHFKIYADGMKKDGMPPKLPLPVNFREKEYWAAVDKGLEPITLGEKTLDQVMDGAVKSCQEVLDKASLVR